MEFPTHLYSTFFFFFKEIIINKLLICHLWNLIVQFSFALVVQGEKRSLDIHLMTWGWVNEIIIEWPISLKRNVTSHANQLLSQNIVYVNEYKFAPLHTRFLRYYHTQGMIKVLSSLLDKSV